MAREQKSLFRLHKRARLSWAGALSIIVVSAFLVMAASDAFALRVTLKRVEFEGPKRTEILTIVNNTAEEQVYRLGWRRMRMSEDSSLKFIEDNEPAADLKPAADMVKYAPRRIVLPPGGSQQVRLLLRRPKDLEPGEYRSHLWIQPEAESVSFQPVEAQADRPTVQIKMLTGLTLPVFVRAGNLSAKAAISNIRATRAGDILDVKFTLQREGNRSLFGDLQFICDGTLAKEIRGLAVYTEVVRRNLDFDVDLSEKGIKSCQQLTVKYVAPEEDVLFKGGVMAEGTARI